MKHLLCASAIFHLTISSAGCAHDPARPDPYLLNKQLARALVSHSEWKGAMPALLELRARHPDDAEVHVLLGTVYREQKLFDAGEEEYQRAISLDSRMADAYAGMGVLRDLRGDAGDGALDDLKKAITIAPTRAAYYNNLGFALYQRAKYVDAVTAYREALRRDPTSRRVRNNLGFAYGKLGHFNLAKREFEHGGSPAEAENNLGFVFEENGNLEAACDRYRESASLQSEMKAAVENLQRACNGKHAPPVANAVVPAATDERATSIELHEVR